MNVGTDLGQYVWILLTIPVVITGLIFFYNFVKLLKMMVESDEEDDIANRACKRKALATLFLFFLMMFSLWVRFGMYGPGIAPNLTPAEQDGGNLLDANAPEEKDLQIIKSEAEESKPEVLKQVERKSKEENSDEEFMKYLDDALKVKNYQGQKEKE